MQLFIELALYEFEFVIGLNWTVSLKRFEVTFVVIWCFINKTELN